ncbi:MAG: preprotein translocase subunit SecA [Chloroflexi bacterium]|nr:preprotein translocase subunit SecA [Chloroflexota bacterium]
MFRSITKRLFGGGGDRVLNEYRDRVDQINALEPTISALTDEQLRAKTDAFRARIEEGEPLEAVLPEAFAVVREAAKRTIGQRHFDVQLIGGMVLHEGKIAEMKTGEGKTLTATLAIYLNALLGKGVHLITPNDYLSKVGVQTMGPIYDFLGLSVAVIQNMGNDPAMASFLYDPQFGSNDARYQNLRPVKRVEAYGADITYGTNNEFGFDYLRDNMVWEENQLVQMRGLHYAIVDEVDNILIDEARTPLIISGPAEKPSDLYRKFADLVRRLKVSSHDSVVNEAPDGDYVVDEKDRVAFLTEAGTEKIEKLLGIDELYHPEHAEMIPYLDNCLRAHALYTKDKEYVVQDGQIIIVDEFTGRLMYGRRFSEGLHQAIEAKENVEVRRENLTLATITFQNFFLMYDKLAGMTGTAMTESEEFYKIYKLDVVSIPTNLPIARADNNDLIYINEKAKFEAIANEIKARYDKGQPVLIGTVAIETSERLSEFLKKSKIPHQVLNAKQHEREAGIIAQAGRAGAVTIATNMAGRGVDILLGGNPDGLARQMLREKGIDVTQVTHDDWEAALAEAKAITKSERQKVIDAGGLFVLGTERHEARRIDNQLRGRSGRQGDPGESRFMLSLDDDLVRRFGGERMRGVMNWAKLPDNEPIEHSLITRMIQQAQVRVEGYHFDTRKRVKEYDDVVNRQRDLTYQRRRDILTATESLRDQYMEMLDEAIEEQLDAYFAPESEMDATMLYRQMLTIFPVPEDITDDTIDLCGDDRAALKALLLEAGEKAYDRKTEELGPVMLLAEKRILLMSIDNQWQRHLTDLDILREGIGLVSIAQRDPLVEYKRQSFDMFDDMEARVRTQALNSIFRVQIQQAQATPQRRAMTTGRAAAPELAAASPAERATATAGNSGPERPQPVRAIKRPGPNDPCWCGSGQKYKKCHMKQDRISDARS